MADKVIFPAMRFVFAMVFGLGFAKVVGDVIIQPVSCSFVGDNVVAFPEKKIRTDKTEADSVTETVAVRLAPGTYEIWLESFDDHDESDSTQPLEQWHVLFSNGQESGTIRDLPDDEVQITEMVNGAFVLTDAISEVTAVHSFYPDETSPNSIVPVCVSFVRIDEPTATPTDEPTATVDPTPTGTVEPSATPTNPPEPTWTPQVVPTFCGPAGCTPGGTG